MTEGIAMSNAEIVKTVYDLFRQGDVAGILARFDATIEFRLAEGHPYQPSGRAWIGKDAITREFFAVAGPEWDGWSIAIESLIDNADSVVVECRYRGVYKPTGNDMDVQVCHVWRFSGGKIVSFHQYLDTAHLQRVMGR
jgi:ketosteroid isomerase-like protein